MKNQTEERILRLMLEKIERLQSVVKDHGRKSIETDFYLSDTLQFEFEKLYDGSTCYPANCWKAILRSRFDPCEQSGIGSPMITAASASPS